MIAVPIAGNNFIFLAENLSVGTNTDKKAFTTNMVYDIFQNISVAQIILSRSCLHAGWYRKPLPPTTISHHHFSQRNLPASALIEESRNLLALQLHPSCEKEIFPCCKSQFWRSLSLSCLGSQHWACTQAKGRRRIRKRIRVV